VAREKRGVLRVGLFSFLQRGKNDQSIPQQSFPQAGVGGTSDQSVPPSAPPQDQPLQQPPFESQPQGIIGQGSESPAQQPLDEDPHFQVPDFSDEELAQLSPEPEAPTAPQNPAPHDDQQSPPPDNPAPQTEALSTPPSEPAVPETPQPTTDASQDDQPLTPQSSPPPADTPAPPQESFTEEPDADQQQESVTPSSFQEATSSQAPLSEESPVDDVVENPVTTHIVEENGKTSVFVEKEQYVQALIMASTIENDIRDASTHLTRIIDNDAIITAKLKEWKGLLDDIQEKLLLVDEKMFGEGDTRG